jgi:hypothetical protein
MISNLIKARGSDSLFQAHSTQRPARTGRIKLFLFGINPAEAQVEKRGFNVHDSNVSDRLETVGATFIHGYHLALSTHSIQDLVDSLELLNPETRGFAYEGAGMGTALLDNLPFFGAGRFQQFLQLGGQQHEYMVHVGAGWAFARLPFNLDRQLEAMNPLMRWLCMDGYGFHEGYFNWPQAIVGQKVPKRVHGYARNGFDQGLGRSLWFVHGTDTNAIEATIAAFAENRRADLWSGVGLAAAYAGMTDTSKLQRLAQAADTYRPALCQGVAFAAKARQKAGNLADHTNFCSETLCNLSGSAAAELVDQALTDATINNSEQGSGNDGELPLYEHWRRRTQHQLG